MRAWRILTTALVPLGVRHLATHKATAGVAGFAIACAVAALVATQLVYDAVVASYESTTLSFAGRAGLQVTNGESGVAEEVADELRTVRGVRTVAASVEGFVAAPGLPGERLYLYGIDLLADQQMRNYGSAATAVVSDPLVFLASPDSVAVTGSVPAGASLADGRSHSCARAGRTGRPHDPRRARRRAGAGKRLRRAHRGRRSLGRARSARARATSVPARDRGRAECRAHHDRACGRDPRGCARRRGASANPRRRLRAALGKLSLRSPLGGDDRRGRRALLRVYPGNHRGRRAPAGTRIAQDHRALPFGRRHDGHRGAVHAGNRRCRPWEFRSVSAWRGSWPARSRRA